MNNEERFRKEIFIEKVYNKGIPNKDNLVVVDIGGHVGLFVEYILPKAKIVYTIEPYKPLYDKIVEKFKENDKVKVFNLAIAGKSEKRLLNEEGGDGGSTLIYGNFEDGNEHEIQALSLKDFMKQEGIDYIDLLKIDCEGSEGEIINSRDFKEVAPQIDNITGEIHSGISIDLTLKDLGYKFDCVNAIFSAVR